MFFAPFNIKKSGLLKTGENAIIKKSPM